MVKQFLSRITLALVVGITAVVIGGIAPVNAQYSSYRNSQLDDLLAMGRSLAEVGDYVQAIAVYQQAASLDDDNARILSGIGYLQAALGNYREAASSYQKAIGLEPNNGAFYYAFAYSLAQSGDNENAARAYQRAIELNSNDVNSYVGLGVVLMRQGKYARAMEAYQRSLEINPQDGTVYGYLATALLEQNQTEASLQLLQQATANYPTNSKLWLQLGIFRLGLDRDREGAMRAFQQALRFNPRDSSLYVEIAQALEGQGEKQEAQQIFYQAVVLEDNTFEAQMSLGDTLYAEGAYFPAVVAYRRATELAPDNPVGFHKLGLALAARDRRQEAIEAWEIALRLYQRQGDREGVAEVESLIEVKRREPLFKPFN